MNFQSIGFLKNRKVYLFVIIFAAFLFLRFFHIDVRTPFGNDQMDIVWKVKGIVVDNNFPLLGPEAKNNSGFSIGPGYYYYVTPFYLLSNLHPKAAGFAAGTTAIITFTILFLIIRNIFSTEVAIIAAVIETFSFEIILGDSIQWNPALIVPLSAIIFYLLWKIIKNKNPVLLVPLAFIIGASFHVHFTSVFYFPLIALALPLLPRNKKTLYYALISIPYLLLWLLPNIYYELLNRGTGASNLSDYIKENFLGFHLVRFFQITHDAFIEFNLISGLKSVAFLGPFLLFTFFFAYLRKDITREKIILCYLMAIWILIPWLAFATYKGEISNYYFYITIPIVLMIISYLLYRLYSLKGNWSKAIAVLILIIFALANTKQFMQYDKNKNVESKTNRYSIQTSERIMREKVKSAYSMGYDRYSIDSYFSFLLVKYWGNKNK